MVFETETAGSEDDAPFEGSLPERASEAPFDSLFEAGFVPVECEAGDLLASAWPD